MPRRPCVQAYRLLAEEMYKKGWDYPLHLGVTGEPQVTRLYGVERVFWQPMCRG